MLENCICFIVVRSKHVHHNVLSLKEATGCSGHSEKPIESQHDIDKPRAYALLLYIYLFDSIMGLMLLRLYQIVPPLIAILLKYGRD